MAGRKTNPHELVYNRRPLDVPVFHSTHVGNVLKHLEKGQILSGYALLKNGMVPGVDFVSNTLPMSTAKSKLEKEPDKVFYNTVYTSIGGIPDEAPGLYYKPGCPVSYLFEPRTLQKHYSLGTTYKGAGDLVVGNKNPDKLGILNLKHAKAMFFPSDVYFSKDGKIVVPPGGRYSPREAAERFREKKELSDYSVGKYDALVSKIRQAGVYSQVKDSLLELFKSSQKKAKELYESAPEWNKHDQKAHVDALGKFSKQMHWNSISGLLALDYSGYDAIKRHQDNLNISNKAYDYDLSGESDLRPFVKAVGEKAAAKDLAISLLRSGPTMNLTGFSKQDQEYWRGFYDQHRKVIDSMAEETNSRLGLKGKDVIDPHDFETFKGRLFHSTSNELGRDAHLLSQWEEYRKNAPAGNMASKDFLSGLLTAKGAQIQKDGNEWHIKNSEKLNLPRKIFFFEGDLPDAVNSYVEKNYRIKLPWRMLPNYAEMNRRKHSAVAISDALKARAGRGVKYVGNVPTTYLETEAYTRSNLPRFTRRTVRTKKRT